MHILYLLEGIVFNKKISIVNNLGILHLHFGLWQLALYILMKNTKDIILELYLPH